MEKTVLNIKTERKLKREAQKVARSLGLPLGTIMNAYLREFVREKRIVFSMPPIPNVRTQKLIEGIRKDIKHGRNADGPFNYAEAVRYLKVA